VRSLLILVLVCVCVCLSLLVLLIFGRLPHHCPFPELGLYSDILGLIVLHINMTRRINRIRDLHSSTGSLKDPL